MQLKYQKYTRVIILFTDADNTGKRCGIMLLYTVRICPSKWFNKMLIGQ